MKQVGSILGERFSVTLPDQVAERVRERLRDGHYASIDELMLDGVLALEERDSGYDDPEIEHWLRTEVLAAIKEAEEDPSSLMSSDEVLAEIEAEFEALKAKR